MTYHTLCACRQQPTATCMVTTMTRLGCCPVLVKVVATDQICQVMGEDQRCGGEKSIEFIFIQVQLGMPRFLIQSRGFTLGNVMWIMSLTSSNAAQLPITPPHYGPLWSISRDERPQATPQCTGTSPGRGVGAPQPSGLCKGGQLSVRRDTTGSVSSLTHRPSSTLCFIRSEAHLLHFNKAPWLSTNKRGLWVIILKQVRLSQRCQ